MSTPTMYVLLGAPGSGKSTWSWEQEEALICSADDFFYGDDGIYRFDPAKLGEAHAACFRKAVRAVSRKKARIIIDNTNTRVAEVSPYMALGNAFGYSVIPLLFKGCFQNTHGVSEASVSAAVERLEALIREWPPYWPSILMEAP